MKTKRASFTLAAACLTLLCATSPGLRAATLTVTSLADSGAGTLRAALAGAANGDTITFAVPGTIPLTTGQLSVTRSVTIAGPGAGLLAVYASLYAGKGSLWGWLEYDARRPSASLAGDLRWLRPALPGSPFYPAGFAGESPAIGSRYTPPATATNRVLALTNGVMLFEYGNLAEPITNQITLTASNRVTNLSGHKLSLNFTLQSGLFAGSVQIPGTTRSNSFKGIVLQDRPAGFGYFLGTNQSGRVWLGPQD
jgi:hypothetical protein